MLGILSLERIAFNPTVALAHHPAELNIQSTRLRPNNALEQLRATRSD
jgi:hypothetical protein